MLAMNDSVYRPSPRSPHDYDYDYVPGAHRPVSHSRTPSYHQQHPLPYPIPVPNRGYAVQPGPYASPQSRSSYQAPVMAQQQQHPAQYVHATPPYDPASAVPTPVRQNSIASTSSHHSHHSHQSLHSQHSHHSHHSHHSPATSSRSAWSAGEPSGAIRIRDLAHIEAIAQSEHFSSSLAATTGYGTGRPVKYEISSMPVTDVIEMVAGLLTKITSTNDRQHEHMNRTIPPPEAASSLSQQTTSVLAFHGRNVPHISILSYLSRIHKYCPTTYEVFLSLLVYFDRMTEHVNSGLGNLRRRAQQSVSSAELTRRAPATSRADVELSPSTSFHDNAQTSQPIGSEDRNAMIVDPPMPLSEAETYALNHFFVVDSFNIHRLVIAGVTCASKFFSDVFYTNSRYAKVGGLPLIELNHLELQFLLLNDFRLSIPVEDLEAYGTMLVEFYAREVLAQRGRAAGEAMEGVVGQTITPP